MHRLLDTKLKLMTIGNLCSLLVQAMRSRQKEEDDDEEGKGMKNSGVEEDEEDGY